MALSEGIFLGCSLDSTSRNQGSVLLISLISRRGIKATKAQASLNLVPLRYSTSCRRLSHKVSLKYVRIYSSTFVVSRCVLDRNN